MVLTRRKNSPEKQQPVGISCLSFLIALEHVLGCFADLNHGLPFTASSLFAGWWNSQCFEEYFALLPVL